MGRFKLGSTVILLFAQDKVLWDEALAANSPVKLGEKVASAVS
jgi:phosphatidylserine decarboxylase